MKIQSYTSLLTFLFLSVTGQELFATTLADKAFLYNYLFGQYFGLMIRYSTKHSHPYNINTSVNKK